MVNKNARVTQCARKKCTTQNKTKLWIESKIEDLKQNRAIDFVCVRNMEHHPKKMCHLFIMHVRNMQQKQANKIGNFGLQTKSHDCLVNE